MARISFKFYSYSGKATAFSILTKLFGVVFIIAAIGGFFEKRQELTDTNIVAAIIMLALGIWLLYLSYKKSPKIAEKDFENRVRNNLDFANKMYAENPHIRTHLLLLNPRIAHGNIPELVAQNNNNSCVHQFGEKSGDQKEKRNRSIWEQIKNEEQTVFIAPLDFSWVINGVNHTITITEVPAIVGRDKQYADVIIDDMYVARIHARIDVYRDGKENTFMITDLSSTNGTRLDGKAVSEATIFKSGQTLSFGRVNVSVGSKGK